MRKLIIDNDTAADDSFALLVGLLHPGATLNAVTIVAGNVDFTQQVQNALITIDQAGRSGEVPVCLGLVLDGQRFTKHTCRTLGFR